MNVLIIHNYYKIPGGEDTVFNNEKTLLELNGHRVYTYEKNNSELSNGGILKKMFLPLNAIYNIKTYREVRQIIREKKINIVHIHNTLTMISPSVIAAAKHEDIPAVQTLHNFRLQCANGIFYRDGHICEDCLKNGGMMNALKHSCYRNSLAQTVIVVLMQCFHRMLGTYRYANFIALSEFQRDKLKNLPWINEKKIFVKPNFVRRIGEKELSSLKAAPVELSDGKQLTADSLSGFKVLLYAGRMDEAKGVPELIESFTAESSYKGEKFDKLILAGNGPLRDVIEEEYGDLKDFESKKIIYVGALKHGDLLALMAKCSMLAFPSKWYEGFPMTIIEAYSVGLKVIGEAFGGRAEVMTQKAFYEMQTQEASVYYSDGNYIKLMQIYDSIMKMED